MDMIVKLPLADGFDSILVVVDQFSKMAHFIPCNESMSSDDLAQLYLRDIFRLHGLPLSITSDRGSVFASEFTRRLHVLLGISTRLSTAYHPQTNGQTERTNQTLETYLRAYASFDQSNWVALLPTAEFAYNNACHSSLHVSPFFANYGYDPRFDLSAASSHDPSVVPAAEQFHERMRSMHEELRLELLDAQQNMAKHYNAHRTAPPVFNPGDSVWLLARHLSSPRPSEKLSFRKLGPFRVVSRIGDRDSYRLDLPAEMSRVHPVFNITRLEPAVDPHAIPDRIHMPAPPELPTDVSELDAIENIYDSRRISGRLDYLVGFANRAISDRQWISSSLLPSYAAPLADSFHARFPDRVKRRPRSGLHRPRVLRGKPRPLTDLESSTYSLPPQVTRSGRVARAAERLDP